MSHSAQTDRFVHDRLPPPAQWPHFSYSLPELQLPAQVNLVQALFAGAARRGLTDRPLLRSPRRTLSYAQAQTEVARIAQALVQEHGLVPGNRVLLRGGNSIGMALAWLAVVQAGAAAVATMPLLRAKELGDIIEKAQPTLALCDERLLDELNQARVQQPVLQTLVSFDALHQSGELALAAAGYDGLYPPCATAADDIALLAFTSGTTGKPKAAVHSHRDVLAACETWPRHVLRATPDDIVMGSPPLAFTFGLGGLLIFPMWAGASVYFPDIPYTPQAMAQLIFDTGATIVYTAPTFYRQMAPFMQEQAAQRGQAAALRLSVSAGEGLPDATRQLWKNATGLEMLDGIGATEMFHIFISAAPEQVRRGAIGTVVPGYSARVVGDDGQELPRGSVGRIAVIGPTGCRYLDDARQTNYVKDGWNYPGDAFVQDAEGYFFYQARTDDMIITSGYNVGAPEVEDALLRHPAVAECGVIGQSDEARGMIVKAFCVLRPGVVGDAALVQALQDHVKATIAPYKYPREIEFRDKLPRTETGKLQRFRLKTP
jgi:2-aminobenzoate-CoA ligase